jgi:hypothetical protein
MRRGTVVEGEARVSMGAGVRNSSISMVSIGKLERELMKSELEALEGIQYATKL